MLTRIKQWLEPPDFPGDEEKTTQARIINTVGFYFVLTLISGAVILVPFFVKHKLVAWTIILMLAIGYGISRHFLFRGRLALSVALMVASAWGMSIGVTIIGGGIASPMLFVVMAATNFVGFLLEPRIGTGFVFVSTLAGLGIAVLQQNGIAPPRIFVFSPMATWAMFALALWFIHAVMNLIVRNLQDALVRARQQNAARLHAEATLHESERKFRNIADNIPGMVYQLRVRSDGSTYFSYTSPRAAELFGLPDNLSNPDWDLGELVHPEDRESFFASITQDIADRTTWNYEGRLITRADEVKWFRGISSPTQIGDELTFDGILLDITERHRTEVALRESEERYRHLVEGSPDIVWSFSNKRGTVYVSARVQDMLGYSPDYLYKYPQLWNQSIHLDDRGRVTQAIADFASGKDLDVEYRIKDASGNWRWFHDRSIGRHIEDEETIIEGISTDITARKQMERALQRYADRLAALHALDQAILAAESPEATVQAALDHLWGLVPCEYAWVARVDLTTGMNTYVTGQMCDGTTLQRKPSVPMPDCHIEMIRQHGFAVFYDAVSFNQDTLVTRLMREQGAHTVYFFRLMAREQILGLLGLAFTTKTELSAEEIDAVVEVTDSLAVALHQAQMRAQIEDDARIKDHLLREVNHRVSNNLMAITGLLRTERRHAPADHAQAIGDTLTRLVQRVEGLAEVHRLLSDTQWMPVNLSQLARHIIQMALHALPPDQTIDVHVTPSPITISPRQANNLALILNELTVNTIKYAVRQSNTLPNSSQSRARVCVNVRITKTEADMIVLEYRDDGPGYPEAVLRLEKADVGLYLIQQLSHTLQGTLTLSNDNGAVTTLTFEPEEKNRT